MSPIIKASGLHGNTVEIFPPLIRETAQDEYAQNKSGGAKEASSTSIREAIKQWEEANGSKVSESSEVKLIGLYPPIEKIDQNLNALSHLTKLSMSTNMIEKLTNFPVFSQLKILSLGRNNIKSLVGLESVGETLEQLWISHNCIEKLKGVNVFKRLKVLYMSNNLLKDMGEFMKLSEVTTLEELNFVGNPLEERLSGDGVWREEVQRRLVSVQKLDGLPLIREVSDDFFRAPQEEKTEDVEEEPVTAVQEIEE